MLWCLLRKFTNRRSNNSQQQKMRWKGKPWGWTETGGTKLQWDWQKKEWTKGDEDGRHIWKVYRQYIKKAVKYLKKVETHTKIKMKGVIEWEKEQKQEKEPGCWCCHPKIYNVFCANLITPLKVWEIKNQGSIQQTVLMYICISSVAVVCYLHSVMEPLDMTTSPEWSFFKMWIPNRICSIVL